MIHLFDQIRKKIILLFIFFFFGLSALFNLCFAQNAKIDSLQLVISNSDDTTRLKSMFGLATEYYKTDLKKCILVANQIVDLSKELKNVQKEITAYNLLGYIYSKEGYSFEESLEMYDKGLSLCGADHKILESEILTSKAALYKKNGKVDKAIELYNEALAIATENKGTRQICRLLNSIGNVLKGRKERNKALDYYMEALVLAEEMQNDKFIAILNSNIGTVYNLQNKKDTAILYLEAALEMKKKLGNEYSVVYSLVNVGRLYYEIDQKKRGIRLLTDAYHISKRLDYTDGICLSLKALAEKAYDVGNFTQAISYSKEGLKVLGDKEGIKTKMNLMNVLHESYFEMGQFEYAYTAQTQSYNLKDSIYTLESKNELNELLTKHEVDKKETDNKILKEQQKVDEYKIKQQQWLMLSTFLIIAILVLMIIMLNKNNQRKRQYQKELEREVNIKTEQLQKSNKELVDRNIELESFSFAASHDLREPLRSITGFSYLLEQKDGNNLSTEGLEYLSFIKKSSEQMNGLVDSIREFSSLNKGKTENIDLYSFVNNITEDISENPSFPSAQFNLGQLPIISGSKNQFYLLFKHLIENGIIYNESKRPIINIEYVDTPNSHIFNISDNGVGIDSQFKESIFSLFKRLHNRKISSRPGVGLAICKKIVDDLKGEISCKSKINHGSVFTIQLPKQLDSEKLIIKDQRSKPKEREVVFFTR